MKFNDSEYGEDSAVSIDNNDGFLTFADMPATFSNIQEEDGDCSDEARSVIVEMSYYDALDSDDIYTASSERVVKEPSSPEDQFLVPVSIIADSFAFTTPHHAHELNYDASIDIDIDAAFDELDSS
jgi:hypothetical protein